ncbi:hypothetical protein M433DRAFT_103475 [Acidomyces richmondensis BFW]|nr:hypothetical protein M433DRAFT_103475 [Acidomyces richmondensis BFW]
MKSMQRKFGGLLKRSADEADVSAVLAEFQAVDAMLDSLLIDFKAFRNSWEDILRVQYDCSEAFANLYQPIVGLVKPGDNEVQRRHEPTVTPQRYMQKCLGWQKLHSDLKADLAHEVSLIERRLLRPVEEAKQCLKSLGKTTLKHRENMKLDYERYLSRAEHVRKKENRSAKEELALQTHETNLAQARIDYQTADEQVKQTFPPVTAAVTALLPYLLASQVMLQTTLVGQIYTMLDKYTRAHRLPNPAPTNEEIVEAWEAEFTGFRRELEQGISVVANGKAVHQPMQLAEKGDGSTITGLGIRNKVMNRKGSGQGTVPAAPTATRPGLGARIPKSSVAMSSPHIPLSSKPRISSSNSIPQLGTPYDQKATALMPGSNHSALGAPSPLPSSYSTHSASNSYFPDASRRASQASLASSAVAAVAGKKKPPPPIPTKRIPSGQGVQYVTALYDFEGQNECDLTFKEGDRIRVVRKTESRDDWWDGEVQGRVGMFPANYVQV